MPADSPASIRRAAEIMHELQTNVHLRRGAGFVLETAAASAAMTASQRAEMAATGRAPSEVPVRAVERLTGVTVRGAATRTVVGHLAQASLAATALVLARAIRTTRGAPAVALIAGSLVVGDAALASALGLAQMPWRWTTRDLVVDAAHKTSLALAARTIAVRRRIDG